MYIAQAFRLQFTRRSTSHLAGAGVGIPSVSANRGLRGLRCIPFFEDGSPLMQTWCALGMMVFLSVIFIGIFEANRLTTHVLMSPCQVVASDTHSIGACTRCTGSSPDICEAHPMSAARLTVTFQPRHLDGNVTGSVWYCKEHATSKDPCIPRSRKIVDQLALDTRDFGELVYTSNVPCASGEVFNYMEQRQSESNTHNCYYSSRDGTFEDVWLSMPPYSTIEDAWFQENPFHNSIMLGMGGFILVSVLLICLAMDGFELVASGLV
eukprot:TRINITY_DN69013_c0_g1_i1.p1 TRINITY_DN69013_c0_g1~~TRINITY_DN69013_c0_g1_i1.p1  ORF type:complete len:266 (+),score=43.01 TRINITY_DN69013_c0_g1_i1:239-1036(+)